MAPLVIDVRRAEDPRDVVHRAVQTLTEGGLVAFPTETVYGLAALALDADAVARLVRVKGRKPGHPIALAIKSADEARDYVPDMSALAQRLARRCWPGPVTLVLDDSHAESLIQQLPASVRQAVSPEGTVGLRVPGHQMILDVMKMVAGPLALTSANPTGQSDPCSAQEVLDALDGDVDLVLDDGPTRFGRPSSVVRVRANQYEVLRAGVVPERTLKRLTSLMILFVCTGNTCRSPMAEVICRKLLADRLGCRVDRLEDRGVIVVSAGTSAELGGRAAPEAVKAVAAMGLDLTGHETQPLSEALVRHADWIYAMTASHRQAIVGRWPGAAERTLILAAGGDDIPDPLGGPLERYQRCAAQIDKELRSRLGQWEL
mgnify:CR=1 FL=1